MRVAVSSNGNDLNAPVSPVFGRCPSYLFVDTDTLVFEAVTNPAVSAPGGAGIQAAQMVVNQGVEGVITGNVGPNAFNVLAAAGVDIYLAQTGTVGQVVEALKTGQLQSLSGPSAGMHAGMGMGRGRGRGVGGGMGMGAGMGRGMAAGRSSPIAAAPNPTPPSAPARSPQTGVEELRDQMRELRDDLAQVMDRIDRLEKR